MSNKCYYCEESKHTDSEIYLCSDCEKKLLSRQWKGDSYKEENDNFGVKTIHGQIFQGFKTEEEAQTWANKETDKGFEIIESGYYIETDDVLYKHIMQKLERKFINRFGKSAKKQEGLKFDYNFGDVVLKNNGLAYLITGFGIYDNQVWGSPLYPDGIHLGGDDWLSDKDIIKKVDDVTLLKKIYEEYIKAIVDNYNKFFKDREYKEEQEDIVKRHLQPIKDKLKEVEQDV